MSRIIKPDASISPQEIFARMQGAWFEPRQGSMWQENTGATATTSGGQTVGKLVDLTSARVASQATAVNRPVYQLDSKSLPYLAHDSTDSLVVTLPAINVRRNLLTYSEQFDNAYYLSYGTGSVVADQTVAPNATATADLLRVSSTNGGSYYQGTGWPVGTSMTVSAFVKRGTQGDYVHLGIGQFGAGSNDRRYSILVNLATGQFISAQAGREGLSNTSYTITNVGLGWFRVSITGVIALTNYGFFIEPVSSPTPTFSVTLDITNNVPGNNVFVWGTQLELGAVATDYQKVTDWTSEQYSSSGSTYFSTPTGMSCLHNQSIGTSYNLPALQTDIYGTVITPARLPPPLEKRLALYMHRLAGLADADFFWQEQAADGMTGQLLADDNDTILLRA